MVWSRGVGAPCPFLPFYPWRACLPSQDVSPAPTLEQGQSSARPAATWSLPALALPWTGLPGGWLPLRAGLRVSRWPMTLVGLRSAACPFIWEWDLIFHSSKSQ